MCHPLIMDYVKGKALSRRDFFQGSAAAGAALAATAALSPRPVLAQAATQVVDMTHTLTYDFPTYLACSSFSTKTCSPMPRTASTSKPCV